METLLRCLSSLILLRSAVSIPQPWQVGRPHREHLIREEDIIELPVGRFQEPICNQTVLREGAWGRPLRPHEIVGIGDPLYHRWQCFYPHQLNVNLYCMMVHDCTVTHGSMSVPIIDEFGCTLHPDVIPNVYYEQDLIGGLQINAFALELDAPPTLIFNCGIKLLIKNYGVCRRPTCVPLSYYQRNRPYYMYKKK